MRFRLYKKRDFDYKNIDIVRVLRIVQGLDVFEVDFDELDDYRVSELFVISNEKQLVKCMFFKIEVVEVFFDFWVIGIICFVNQCEFRVLSGGVLIDVVMVFVLEDFVDGGVVIV